MNISIITSVGLGGEKRVPKYYVSSTYENISVITFLKKSANIYYSYFCCEFLFEKASYSKYFLPAIVSWFLSISRWRKSYCGFAKKNCHFWFKNGCCCAEATITRPAIILLFTFLVPVNAEARTSTVLQEEDHFSFSKTNYLSGRTHWMLYLSTYLQNVARRICLMCPSTIAPQRGCVSK